MVSGPQRLQLDAWTAPDLTTTAPALDSTQVGRTRVLVPYPGHEYVLQVPARPRAPERPTMRCAVGGTWNARTMTQLPTGRGTSGPSGLLCGVICRQRRHGRSRTESAILP